MINYGGWQAELINEFGCGFVIPSKNAIEAARIINNNVQDKSKLEKMSKASNYLANKFSVDNNFKIFKGVIDNVNKL